jgi:UDP-3-O-acyl-N-acetylglucosamine deacetylase
MIEALRSELLQRGSSDMLQMVELLSVARRHLGPAASDARVREEVLDVVGDLLKSGQAIVGDVIVEPGELLRVRSWNQTASETVRRIEAQLRDLGRVPVLGEVCWLELTEVGRLAAKGL